MWENINIILPVLIANKVCCTVKEGKESVTVKVKSFQQGKLPFYRSKLPFWLPKLRKNPFCVDIFLPRQKNLTCKGISIFHQ